MSVLLKVLTKAENDGKRRSELMCDIGEEGLSHRGKTFQSQMITSVDALHVEEDDEGAHKYNHHDGKDDATQEACRLFALKTEMRLVHHSCLLVSLNKESCILNAVHLLHVHHAVPHGSGFLVRSKGCAIVAHTLVMLIV